jgi:uncharacterized membrane protein YqaE (UPF0057 family)
MDNKIIMVLLAILLPPIAVYLKKGIGNDLIINVILCVFFYLPGSLHALWLILKK